MMVNKVQVSHLDTKEFPLVPLSITKQALQTSQMVDLARKRRASMKHSQEIHS